MRRVSRPDTGKIVRNVVQCVVRHGDWLEAAGGREEVGAGHAERPGLDEGGLRKGFLLGEGRLERPLISCRGLSAG